MSLDRIIENGYDATDDANIEEIITDKILLDALLVALDTLSAEEINLINDIFYRNKSERNIATELGISQFGVNKRKHKILEKLCEILKDFS